MSYYRRLQRAQHVVLEIEIVFEEGFIGGGVGRGRGRGGSGASGEVERAVVVDGDGVDVVD